MNPIKQPLDDEQLSVLTELIKMANIGNLKEKSCLTEYQMKIAKDLKRKGYVSFIGGKFMVLMSP